MRVQCERSIHDVHRSSPQVFKEESPHYVSYQKVVSETRAQVGLNSFPLKGVVMDKEENLLMVHLSDIHCGPKLQGKTLQRAIDEINVLAPDVVAVTGDLTEEGLFEEFQEARRYLQQLRCKNLVVVSGNHDARTTGYRLFPDFFGESTSVVELKGKLIIKLDSSRPDRDDGEVGYRQRLWLKECLDKSTDRFKIVLLHHHLMPIPDTGMEKNMTTDAGDVLWSLISHGANAVLCGHRHRPWLWTTGDLNIVYAGAVSTNRLRGFYRNSYNIIRVEGNRLTAKLKIVGEDECELDPAYIKTLKSSTTELYGSYESRSTALDSVVRT